MPERDFRADKQLPLELTQRRQYQEDEDKTVRMFRKFQAQRKNARKRNIARPDEDDIDVANAQDLILEETVNIMADYISARRQQAAGPAATAAADPRDDNALHNNALQR